MNPTARKQTLRPPDMRVTVDREEFFAFQYERRLIEGDRALGRRPRRAPRLHTRARGLAQDAGASGSSDLDASGHGHNVEPLWLTEVL